MPEENKICPKYDVICEAYNGKSCCLVLDEECHYIYNQNLKIKVSRRASVGIKTLEGVFSK